MDSVSHPMNPVRDMGDHPNCWSLGATGSIEGLAIKTYGRPIELSEQFLVDYVKKFYDDAGEYIGGWAYEFINRFWISFRDDYDEYSGPPNRAQERYLRRNQQPMYTPDTRYLTISAWRTVPPNNELELERRVRIQPVTATVWVNKKFQNYGKNFFYHHCEYGSDEYEGSHVVTIYGFDANLREQEYWKVRNCWGAEWGRKGCIRMAKNIGISQGICGIATECLYPVDYLIE